MRQIWMQFESSGMGAMARGPQWWMLMMPGACLCLLGILIYAVPQILVALVSGALIALGVLLMIVVWRFRQASRG
jgi:hypothetical protein